MKRVMITAALVLLSGVMLTTVAVSADPVDPTAAASEAPVAEPSPAATPPESDGRIINGTEAAPGSAPWMVELYLKVDYTCGGLQQLANSPDTASQRFARSALMTMGEECLSDPATASTTLGFAQSWQLRHVCGGALIEGGWIVTAAHCFQTARAGHRVPDPATAAGQGAIANIMANWIYKAGTQDISVAGISLQIDAVFIPQSYIRTEFTTGEGDIALVKVRNVEALKSPAIRPIRLASADTDTAQPGRRLLLTGWGSTSPYLWSQANAPGRAPDKPSSMLLQVPLVVSNETQCGSAAPAIAAAYYKGPNALPPGAICAKAMPVRGGDGGSCQGDSGGPLLLDDKVNGSATLERQQRHAYLLAGVVSRGPGCGMPGVSYVYTRVSSYAAWIAKAQASGKRGGLFILPN